MAGWQWQAGTVQQSRGYVVVIGGANLDVVARPHRPTLPATSNPGRVALRPGGVARNVAENLARLGTRCHLVSAVGADPYGGLVLRVTAEAGVDVAHVREVSETTGVYVAVLDHEGELDRAVVDTAACSAIDPDHVAAVETLLAGAGLVVLDGNLGTDTLRAAWDAALAGGARVAIDPASVPKAAAVGPLVDGSRPLHLLAGTRPELEAVTAVETGEDDGLHARGVATVWERRGPAGSVLRTASGCHELAARPTTVVDVTGAGDALLAAYCHAVVTGAAPEEAAEYAHAAAALTVASPHTVRPDLSDELVRTELERSLG